jgi:cytochrome c oxidase subunit 1
LADGGATYAAAEGIVGLPGWVLTLHEYISHATWGLGLAQLPFIINLVYTLRRGKPATDNPWQATTLEWQTASPPPHGNFAQPVNVRRGPYEYSVPETAADFLPQNQ